MNLISLCKTKKEKDLYYVIFHNASLLEYIECHKVTYETAVRQILVMRQYFQYILSKKAA